MGKHPRTRKRDHRKISCLLTPHEIELARAMLLSGMTTKEIGEKFGLSPRSINVHINSSTLRMKANDAHYTTGEVLELTQMSRFTLMKKRKAGLFPDPQYKGDRSNADPAMRSDRYCKIKVNDWLQRNTSRVALRSAANAGIYVKFEGHELHLVKEACKLFDCNLEPFIKDAVLWKAKRTLENY